MIKNELFFHQQTPNGRSLGFSARFVPATGTDEVNQFGERMVWMNTTRCNKADKFFNKKIARATLRDRPLELVRCKDVPHLMGQVYWQARFGGVGTMHAGGQYYSLLKKFL